MASPYRDRSVGENLDLLRRMKAGEFPDGAHVLRLKIDMASPNINLRDPAIIRIRHAWHHRTGDTWRIYPLYDYTHCISDALERITHSICTLEFQDHRPLYDWVIDKLQRQLERPLPQQYEFARLNLTYLVLSKRKLIELVEQGHVEGWNYPRMPTLVGARRRGYTPEGFRLFNERVGVSKSDSWIDFVLLEDAMREKISMGAPNAVWPCSIRSSWSSTTIRPGQARNVQRPIIRRTPELGKRLLPFGRELLIERDDYTETPPKGYFRLTPGAEVRLRYAYFITCREFGKDANGEVVELRCGEMAQNVHQLRPKTPDSEKITINLGYVDLGQIDLMVQEGFYSNRTDFIRSAIRNQLERHADVVKHSTVRNRLDLGLRYYTPRRSRSGAARRRHAAHQCAWPCQHRSRRHPRACSRHHRVSRRARSLACQSGREGCNR